MAEQIQPREGACSGTQTGPRPIKARDVYLGSRRRHSFSLGLRVEIHAIKACIMENIEKGYTGRNICVLFDSQAAIKALDSLKINSKLVCNCHQSLEKMADQTVMGARTHGN
jgi:hypothetical protein